MSVRLATVVSEFGRSDVFLFLPAAGFQYGVSYNGGYVAQWGIGITSSLRPHNLLVSASQFRTLNTNGNFDQFRLRSVRLATIVSGLTGGVCFVPACCGTECGKFNQPGWRVCSVLEYFHIVRH